MICGSSSRGYQLLKEATNDGPLKLSMFSMVLARLTREHMGCCFALPENRD